MTAVLAILVAAISPGIDVKAQSLADKALCSNPNHLAKTCSAIARYTISPNGSARETTELLIAPTQHVTLEMSATASIDGNSVCGSLSMLDLEAGIVRINGERLPKDRHAAALGRLVEALKPMVGRRTCDALQIVDGQLLKFGQVDGVEIKLPGKPVAWIAKDAGYTVVPAPTTQ